MNTAPNASELQWSRNQQAPKSWNLYILGYYKSHCEYMRADAFKQWTMLLMFSSWLKLPKIEGCPWIRTSIDIITGRAYIFIAQLLQENIVLHLQQYIHKLVVQLSINWRKTATEQTFLLGSRSVLIKQTWSSQQFLQILNGWCTEQQSLLLSSYPARTLPWRELWSSLRAV